MPRLREHVWAPKYHSDAGALVRKFYVPALACAVRYDRTTGYFTANALTLAARGVEGLIRNRGRMRLVVGCTLKPPEVEAIERGTALREAVAAPPRRDPSRRREPRRSRRARALRWMIAKGILDVKVAVPCGPDRKPCAADGIFHEKAGIVEDAEQDRIAFNGSVNETARGWSGNWESFHVFTAFAGGDPHVSEEEVSFALLWSDRAKHVRVVDVPQAVRENLLKFLPDHDGPPRRLAMVEGEEAEGEGVPRGCRREQLQRGRRSRSPRPASTSTSSAAKSGRSSAQAPTRPDGGERVGEATSAVAPWPHQMRAFQRLYEPWPPKLLIADEVGLGKTIEAGLLLRQAWLSGRAKRILVLAPKAVLDQWQIELREKFNLNWPIYDGRVLRWYPCPALGGAEEREVASDRGTRSRSSSRRAS